MKRSILLVFLVVIILSVCALTACDAVNDMLGNLGITNDKDDNSDTNTDLPNDDNGNDDTDKPNEPDTPEEPDVPSEPENPDDPQEPDVPSEPDTPSEPDNPDIDEPTIHTCSFGDWIIIPSTCITKGSKTRSCECGEVETEELELDPNNHVFSNWVVTPSTCTTQGSKSRTCECDYTETEELELDPNNHVFSNWVVTPATCTVKGNKVRFCECGEEETEELELDPNNHTQFSDWTTIPSTCTTQGSKSRTCECDYTETEELELDPNNHVFSNWVITPATCTVKGNKVRSCECGEKETEELELDPNNHVFSNWVITPATCTVKGNKVRSCECGEKEVEELELDSTAHKYEDTYSYNDTYHFYACEYCGKPQENIAHTMIFSACTNCDYVSSVYTEGLEFTLNEKTDTYSVTDYTGTSIKVIIPYVYKGKFVTSIDARAFEFCSNLTSIAIPASVTSIGERAFYDCDNLTSITIPASVTRIGYAAFYRCYKLVEVFNLSSLNITIGSSDYGYVGCYALDIYTSLDIPSKLSTDENGYVIYTDSEDKILVGYTGTDTELILPDGITQINKYAFCYNDNITSVTIPAGVTSIDEDAFEYCYKLVEVFNLSSLNITIGSSDYGYVGCYALDIYTSLDIPSKLSTDENGYIIYTGKILVGYTGTDTELTLPKGITQINKYAFYDNDNITSITIPASVTSIGDNAFAYCSNLTTVTFEENSQLTSIGDRAFENCSKLNSITIPASVTSIGVCAFYGCYNLTSITIPARVTSIGSGAFNACYRLVEVYNLSYRNITKGSSDYGYVGYYALGIYTSLDTPSKLSTDENGYIIYTGKILVGYTGTDRELILPDGITKIHNYAFDDNDNITSVTIPTSVTSIGDYAFYGCSNLTTVNYLGTLEQWLNISFDWGSNPCFNGAQLYINGTLLIELVIPDTITKIKNYAFNGCTSITSVTIPASVTSIGSSAFRYCYNLVEVYNLSSLNITMNSEDNGYVGYYALGIYTSLDTPSKLSTDENGYIIYTDGEDKILVGYTGTDTELTLPNGITEINKYAFCGNNNITSVTIPASVTSIGNYAFDDCSNLTTVNYLGTLEQWLNISFGGFYANPCNNGAQLYIDGTLLTEVVIPDTITEIKDCAFWGCISITSVTISAGVTRIGDSAFYGCSNLTNITIPASVTSIGEDAFSDCPITYANVPASLIRNIPKSDLTTVIINSGTSIYSYAFSDFSRLTSITIPASVTKIGDYAFHWCNNLRDIYYTGTEEQWNAISKKYDWNYGGYTIHYNYGK